MKIDVVLNPAEIATLPSRDLSRTTCVVFDILRATSSIVTGLAHGALEIVPARTIEEARALKAKRSWALLGGERHGEKIDGFDLGNSPFEYRDVAGKTVITTTTNGTIALRACEKAERVLVGALLNLAAVAGELRRARPESMLLVCAGTFTEFALEDAYAAGMLVAEMLDGASPTDAAVAALAVARTFSEPLDALHESRNGRSLGGKGREMEVEWCAQVSKYPVLGELREGVVSAARGSVSEGLEPALR